MGTRRESDVIGMLQQGQSPEEIAQQLRRPLKSIERIRQTAIESLTLVERTPGQIARAQRNKAMADAVRRGKSVAEVAAEFGKTIVTVRAACAKHGVEIVSNEPVVGMLPVVAKLIEALADEVIAKRQGKPVDGRTGRRGKSQREIGRELGVSGQFVDDVQRRAEEAGVFAAVDKVITALRER